MRRFALLSSLLTVAAFGVSVPSTKATSSSPLQSYPFTPAGNSAAFKARLFNEFPNSRFPPKERILCTTGEHSVNGPTSYCFAEFRTGSTWNLVEGAVTLNLVTGTEASVSIYGHTTWRRAWRRCRLGKGTPGKLFANDDCGQGQPEQPNAQTDGELVELEALPRINSHKRLRSISRNFVYSGQFPALAIYRASIKHGVYTFTNALGDSLRYRP